MGDFVLVFRPIKRSKLENLWQGPYPISKRVSEVTFQIFQGNMGKRFRTFHVNCMTKWTSPVPAAFITLDKERINEQTEEISNLIEIQTTELNKLKEKFKDVIEDVLGRMSIEVHAIPMKDAPPIRLSPCKPAHHSKEFFREEISTLLDQQIIEPSKSPWAAPVVLVAKKDSPQHMCLITGS